MDRIGLTILFILAILLLAACVRPMQPPSLVPDQTPSLVPDQAPSLGADQAQGMAAGPAQGLAAGQAQGPVGDDSVASDLQALAGQTWAQFLASFPARNGCLTGVRLHAAQDLADRAIYDAATATVTVRVPATRAMLQSALVHEWAHHLETVCAAQQVMRPAFLRAQGLPADTAWSSGSGTTRLAETDWAQLPSEQFAEAAVELVLGRRQIPTGAYVTNEAVQVVREWGAGP